MASVSPVIFQKRTFLLAGTSVSRGKIESVLDLSSPFADPFDFAVVIILALPVIPNR